MLLFNPKDDLPESVSTLDIEAGISMKSVPGTRKTGVCTWVNASQRASLPVCGGGGTAVSPLLSRLLLL